MVTRTEKKRKRQFMVKGKSSILSENFDGYKSKS